MGHQSVMRRLFLVLVVATLAACHVQFVSDYDEIFDQQAAATQREIDGLLQKISDDAGQPDGRYAPNKEAYEKILVDMNSLLIRARLHDDNADTIDQVSTVITTVNNLKKLHEKQDSLSVAFDSRERSTINSEFSAMMRLELLKKRGKDTGGTR